MCIALKRIFKQGKWTRNNNEILDGAFCREEHFTKTIKFDLLFTRHGNPIYNTTTHTTCKLPVQNLWMIIDQLSFNSRKICLSPTLSSSAIYPNQPDSRMKVRISVQARKLNSSLCRVTAWKALNLNSSYSSHFPKKFKDVSLLFSHLGHVGSFSTPRSDGSESGLQLIGLGPPALTY